jgi:hypothetical protein
MVLLLTRFAEGYIADSCICDRVGRRFSRRTDDGCGIRFGRAMPVIRVRKPARAAFIDKRRR